MNLLHVIPFLVVLFEYTALSASFAFARFAVDYDPPLVGIFGGIINIGGNLPYNAVPHIVITLHTAALIISVTYLVYSLVIRTPFPKKEEEQVPPQDV